LRKVASSLTLGCPSDHVNKPALYQLNQSEAEIRARTAMAEKDLDEHGSVGGARDGTWEMASGERLFCAEPEGDGVGTRESPEQRWR
jgi:hypothetical protein